MELFSSSLFFPIFMFSFATSITPGPNNIMLLSSGLTFGYRRTLPHTLGVVLGFPLMTMCVGMGLGTVFQAYPSSYTLLKVVGTLYLLWLAYHIATSTPTLQENNPQPLHFSQVVIFQWVSPKNWVKIITATSVYVTSITDSLPQIFAISIIFFSTVIISANSWALGGVFLQNFLKSKASVKKFNMAMAILLVLSIIPTL